MECPRYIKLHLLVVVLILPLLISRSERTSHATQAQDYNDQTLSTNSSSNHHHGWLRILLQRWVHLRRGLMHLRTSSSLVEWLLWNTLLTNNAEVNDQWPSKASKGLWTLVMVDSGGCGMQLGMSDTACMAWMW